MGGLGANSTAVRLITIPCQSRLLSQVWRLLSGGTLPFCNLNSKLCRDPSDFYVQSKQDNKFPARTWGETYCPKFIKFKLLARKWNFRRPIPPPPPSPTTTNIEKNISSHHHYWPKHFLIISEKCWFISFFYFSVAPRWVAGSEVNVDAVCCEVYESINWYTGANTNLNTSIHEKFTLGSTELIIECKKFWWIIFQNIWPNSCSTLRDSVVRNTIFYI